MSEWPDPNEHIREYLRDYLNQTRAPGYAVMVRGAWGIGKTFLIRKILSEQFQNDSDYIYVSLYGVSTPEEIDTAILAAMYPILGTKAGKVTGRLLNAGMKYFRVDGTVAMTDIIDRTSAAAYVFDDVERSSMKPDAIFGYINQFVEHAGCRVILVANEAELERTEGYRTKREKLVGQTLEAKSAIDGALTAFLAEISNADTRKYLTSVRDQIVGLYAQGGVNNLRVLRQTIWDFERFYVATQPDHRDNGEALLHILQILFALSFEIKLGRIEAGDLRGRQNTWMAAAMRDGEQRPFKVACDRYQGVDLHDTTLSDELLEELLVRGVVDADLIRRDLEASSWFVDVSQEPSWRTLWYRLAREDEAVSKALDTLKSELATYVYREPGEILHVFGLLLKLSELGIVPEDRDAVVGQGKAYIDTLRAQGGLPPIKSDSFLEDTRFGAWGGLGITEAGTSHLGELYGYLNEKRALVVIDKLPARAEELLQELETNPELFCRRLVGPGGDQSELIDGPVLAEIDPAVFLATLERQPATVQFRVVQCLASRHGQGGFSRGLEAERPWANTLSTLMLARVETAEPIRREKLTEFAAWIGTNAKDSEPHATTEEGNSRLAP